MLFTDRERERALTVAQLLTESLSISLLPAAFTCLSHCVVYFTSNAFCPKCLLYLHCTKQSDYALYCCAKQPIMQLQTTDFVGMVVVLWKFNKNILVIVYVNMP